MSVEVDAALEELAGGEGRRGRPCSMNVQAALAVVVGDGADVARPSSCRTRRRRDEVQMLPFVARSQSRRRDVAAASRPTRRQQTRSTTPPFVKSLRTRTSPIGVAAGEVAVGDRPTSFWKNQKPIRASPSLSKRSAPK